MRYESPLGPLWIESRNGGISKIAFDGQCDESCRGDGAIVPENDVSALESARLWLDVFFSGRDPGTLPPLTPQGTAFQQTVWSALTSVPYGHTASYGQIACMVHCRSAQAVGQAIHRNPVAIIIPCHRIIGANGALTGYAAGLSLKASLLQLEGSLLL